MQSKTKQAVGAFQAGDLKGALKIASTFRIGVSAEAREVLKRGYECIVHPNTYRQMGKDPEGCIKEASAVFYDVFIQGL